MGKFGDEDDLELDICYALRRARVFPLKRGSHSIDWAKVAAMTVVTHLRMCGWELRRQPPISGHARGTREPDDGGA